MVLLFRSFIDEGLQVLDNFAKVIQKSHLQYFHQLLIFTSASGKPLQIKITQAFTLHFPLGVLLFEKYFQDCYFFLSFKRVCEMSRKATLCPFYR